MRVRSGVSGLLAMAVVASVVVLGGGARAAASCASDPNSGGDWASYGADITNSRNQTSETQIDPSNAGNLEAAWTYASTGVGSAGPFFATPVIAGGCVYITNNTGLTVLNADTAEVVWQALEPSSWNFSPAVVDGVVYLLVGRPTVPYVVARDALTSEELWRTNLYYHLQDGELDPLGSNASVVVFNGMVFVGLSGADLLTFTHPSFYILDAFDGRLLKKTLMIEQDEWLAMYSGGGIWTTAVVDLETEYLYIGTANPYNKRQEHDMTNSLVKIDVDRDRYATFGEVVGFYKGEADYSLPNYFSAECELLGELIVVGFSTFCGQLDIDFGASPSLWKNSSGRTILSDLQKSCTVHAIDAGTMKPVWVQYHLAQGGASGCASTSAVDETSLYVTVNGGQMHAFDKDTGAELWKTVFSDTGARYQPVSVANGVVYTVGNNGHLAAFDAATGAILVDEPMTGPGGKTCASTSGAGIAIARNTVYAACDNLGAGGGETGLLFAYRLS